MDNTTTLIGNVTRSPELRFLNNGSAVATFSIAVARRWQNRQTNEWDEETSFFDVSVFGDIAENIAASIDKGMRVIVTGRLEQQTWEDKDSGRDRSKVVVIADDVAPSLKWATVSVTRKSSSQPNQGRVPR